MVAITRRSRALAIVAVLTLALALLFVAGSDDDRQARQGHSTSATVTPRSSSGARSLAAADNASFGGTVRDDHGDAIAGATVCARSIDAVMPITCATTTLSGTYEVDGIVAGGHVVSATAVGRYPGNIDPQLHLAPGEHRGAVDLVLRRGGAELHGNVRSSSGTAIFGARIEVAGMVTRTDANGHYSVWLAPGWALIHVVADGYASVYRGGPVPGDLGAVLGPGSSISGTVVDDHGEPVEGAWVAASHSDPLRNPLDAPADPVVTDEHGHFALTGIVSGRYEVTARAPHGRGLVAVPRVAVGAAIDGVVVQLVPGFQILATIETTDGAPCPYANAEVEDARGHQVFADRDPDGVLHIGGLAAGDYSFSVSCGDHLDVAPRRIAIVDRDIELSSTAAAGATIRGHVATISGQPVAGVDVTASGHDASGAQLGRFVTTSADGSYAIAGLPPGVYKLMTTPTAASNNNFVQLTATVEVHGADTVTHDFAVDETSLGSIAGHLSSTGGGLPPRLSATLTKEDPNRPGVMIAVDESGAFAANGLPAGSYHLTVSSDGVDIPVGDTELGYPIEITSGKTTAVNLAIHVGRGEIRGRVVDARGMPVVNAIVMMEPATISLEPHFESDLRTMTAADGGFAITGLVGPSYHVRAAQREGVDIVHDSVTVGGDVTLQLPPAVSIVGVAHRRAGSLGDLEVALYGPSHSLARSQTFAQSDGRFVLDDIPAGTYKLVVDADGSNAAVDVVVDGNGPTHVDVDLPELVTLVGRVVDARTGKAIAGVAVAASAVDDQSNNRATLDGGAHISGPDGRFTIAGVPPRKVSVSASPLDIESTTYFAQSEHDVSGAGDVVDIGEVVGVTHGYNNTGDCGCQIDDARAEVVSVNEDGPAASAGIVVGDVITDVDGVDTTGDRTGLARWLLGGDKGSTTTVTLQRGDMVTLVRAP